VSLRISNLATAKQKAFLEKLGYSGRGQYALEALSFDEASDLINELIEEQRLMERDEDKYTWDY
jgi:hypothetical protein